MIIDFNKQNGGGSSGVTPEQVQAQIDSALTYYWESGITKEYVDSADTIIYASATSRMDDVEQVVSSALNEFHEQIMELSARTPDLSNYWTSSQTESAISAAITQVQDQLDTIDEVIPAAIVDLNERVDGFSDIELPISAAVNKLKGDFEARLDQQYYKKQEVNNLLKDKLTAEQVDVRIKNYADPLFQAVYETIEDKELPISAALNELNEAIDLIDEVVPAALVNLNETKVGSDSVHTIWRGTQTAYDGITTKDASTLYIIVNE